MKKQNSYLLKVGIFITVLVLLASGLFNYTIFYVNSYYELPFGDVSNSTVSNLGHYIFGDGRMIEFGTFRQSDDLMLQKELFIKIYDFNTGNFIKSVSAIIPETYVYKESASSETDLYLLFVKEGDNKAPAYYFQFDTDGLLKSSGYIKYHDSSAESSPKSYYISTYENYVRFGIQVDLSFIIYNQNMKQISILTVMPGATVSNMAVLPDGSYVLAGSILSGNTYHGFYSRYNNTGEELYTRSMLTDYTSKCSEISFIKEDNDGTFYILGYYFDAKKFIDDCYKGTDTFSESDIAKISNESILRTESGINVLISETYRTAPWCNIFIVKVESDGTINTVLNTSAAGANTGTGKAYFIYNATPKGATNRKTPLAMVVSATAKKKSAEQYQLRYYYVYADLSSGISTDLSFANDTNINIIGKADDLTGIYTSINGDNSYSLHTYESALGIQKDSKIISICRLFVKVVSNSSYLLPQLLIYAILIISLGYKMKEYEYNNDL